MTRRTVRVAAVVVLVLGSVWLVGVGRAAKVVGDFCATVDRAELEQQYGPLQDGFNMRTDLFPPRATCIFETIDGQEIRVSDIF